MAVVHSFIFSFKISRFIIIMRFTCLIASISGIFSLASCTDAHRLRGAPVSDMPRASHALLVRAGQNRPMSGHPTLVRIQRNGLAVFLAYSEKEIEVCAAPGETIPEGDSDFCGSVVSVDYKSQTAVIRIYDIGSSNQ